MRLCIQAVEMRVQWSLIYRGIYVLKKPAISEIRRVAKCIFYNYRFINSVKPLTTHFVHFSQTGKKIFAFLSCLNTPKVQTLHAKLQNKYPRNSEATKGEQRYSEGPLYIQNKRKAHIGEQSALK